MSANWVFYVNFVFCLNFQTIYIAIILADGIIELINLAGFGKSAKKEGIMFGFMDGSVEKLVQKGKWEKIRKSYLNGDKGTQLDLAKACGTSKSDDSVNVLIALLDVADDEVQIEALKSITVVANDHAVAPLQHYLTKLKPEQTALKAQFMETITVLRGNQ